MSMLTFYINRAGKNLEAHQRQVLEAAKNELRRAFGREPRQRVFGLTEHPLAFLGPIGPWPT